MRVERWELATLAAILLLALVLRIIGLNAQLWYDEIFTLTHYVREPLPALLTDFSSLNNHMFYSLQAKASVALFGESAWALRLPAVVFALGSLVVLWQLGRDAAGRVPALLAVFLMAISYHHVWFAQNARGYTGLLFWTSLATLLLVRNLERPDWRITLGYGLCVAAAMYTHLSAGFFFAAQAAVWAVASLWPVAVKRYSGLRDWRPFAAFAFGGVLTLLLHLPLVSQVLSAVHEVSRGKTESSMAEWVNPLRTLQEIVASLGGLGPLAPVALAGALLLIVLGLVRLWRRAPLLVAVYALSIPLTLAILLSISFRIWPRYFFVDIGFVFLCVVTGAAVLSDWLAGLIRRPQLAPGLLLAAAAVMAAASGVLLVRNYALPKQDFGGAMALIATQRAPGDVATSLGLASEPLHALLAPDWPVANTPEDLAKIAAGATRVWVVTAFDDHMGPGQQPAFAALQRDYVLVGKFDGTVGDGTVKVYRSR